jgi:hypothetical protein
MLPVQSVVQVTVRPSMMLERSNGSRIQASLSLRQVEASSSARIVVFIVLSF